MHPFTNTFFYILPFLHKKCKCFKEKQLLNSHIPFNYLPSSTIPHFALLILPGDIPTVRYIYDTIYTCVCDIYLRMRYILTYAIYTYVFDIFRFAE